MNTYVNVIVVHNVCFFFFRYHFTIKIYYFFLAVVQKNSHTQHIEIISFNSSTTEIVYFFRYAWVLHNVCVVFFSVFSAIKIHKRNKNWIFVWKMAAIKKIYIVTR